MASTPAKRHQRKIHFNCTGIVSGAPEIILAHQDFSRRKMWKHFATDRFQLHRNRLWRA